MYGFSMYKSPPIGIAFRAMEERTELMPREFKRRNRGWVRRIGADGSFRTPLARYVLIGLFAAGIVIAALTLLASVMVVDWS